MPSKLPSVVIAGRPNVGKSTLFNRLTSSRRSIVTDEPGITRDRIYGKVNWEDRSFELVDTGGLIPDDKALIPREILRQAQLAIESADLLVIVTDARAGLTPPDKELARLLRTSGKPLIIAANKVDDFKHESLTAPFYELGVPVFGVSAEHGFGVDVLLDYITEKLGIEREDPEMRPTTRQHPKKTARRTLPSALPSSVGPMSASLLCSTSSPARSAASSRPNRAPRAIPWTPR